MAELDLENLKKSGLRYSAIRASAAVTPSRGVSPDGSSATDARRIAYLSRTSAKAKARTFVEAADAAKPGTSRTDTLETLSLERIVGRSDLLDVNYLELAVAVGRGVARVHCVDGFGTGFLVGPGLLMTNHHVLGTPAEAAKATVQFEFQEDGTGTLLAGHGFQLVPDRVFITNAELDFTIVAVADVGADGKPISDYPWTPLIGSLGKATRGDAVNVIQHPRGGPKQIALRNNEIVELPNGKSDFLYYTTDTEPGSSGSPCFNDQWELIALHHSGVPRLDAAGAILKADGSPFRAGVDPDSAVDWIANEGARVSAIVAAIGKDARAPTPALDTLLHGKPPNPVELARTASRTAVEAGRPKRGRSNGQDELRISLTVSGGTIRSLHFDADGTLDAVRENGERRPAAMPVVDAPHAVQSASLPRPSPRLVTPDAEEAFRIDPDWASRPGYLEDFLGISVPLPKLTAAQVEQTLEVPPEWRRNAAERYLLRYHHFSVLFNATRRLAWYSAANVDGDRRFRFERTKDRWFVDPRIDDEGKPQWQMGEELYASADTDRGHLTRYLDVAWGDTVDEAKTAAADSFHFTNCALQLSKFNQGKDRWQGLEQFLLERKARPEKRRINVITGPVFSKQDPKYRNSQMDYDARVPLAFWKICALVRTDGSLATSAFVLGQPEVLDLPDVEEKFDAGAAQVPLEKIEALTGFDLGALKDHDVLAAGRAPGTLERGGGARVVRLEQWSDMAF